MRKYKMTSLLSAMTVVWSLCLAGASPAFATTNINVAVAANFCAPPNPGDPTPLGDLITAFQTANPSYTVTLVQCAATGTLASQITGGNSLGVDLFLAANSATPASLASGYGVGSTFTYAVGTLAFWSKSVNVSAGYNSSTYSKVAVANTTTAPYGTAASQLLTGRYGLTAPLSSNSLVNIYSNIDSTFQAVNSGSETVGFVALSQICSAGTYPSSGYALVYPPTDTSVSPVVYNYDPINQAGLRIAHSRTTAQDTELDAFVSYLTDHTLSPQSQMITTLLNYCYGVP